MKYNICICSGGNISHALAGYLTNNKHKINLLTRNPEKWSDSIEVNEIGKKYVVRINNISNDPKLVVPMCNIIIISAPIFAISDIIDKIKPYLNSNMTIIGIPGRLYSLFNNDLKNINQIYILRTPFISRTMEYGKSVKITGYAHKKLDYWSNNFDKSEIILKNLFNFKLNKLFNIESLNLVNSNSILHPSRLYVLFKDKLGYTKIPLFYKEWCLESSKLLIKCDEELTSLINEINKNEKNKIYFKTILNHYESQNALELTNKIKSLKSISLISTPVIKKNKKYYCNLNNRYITEDIFIGVKYLLQKGKIYNVKLNNIQKIYDFFFYLSGYK